MRRERGGAQREIKMAYDELQVENGNFTRIVNPLIERLIQIPFKGCELAVAIYIIRKTYGYQKKEDEISLTQFQKDLLRSRQTIVTALKNLRLVNVAILVKQGDTNGSSNTWAINKYYDTWKLVNMARLVKRNAKPSLTERLNLVYMTRHTKENTKETKDIPATPDKAFSLKEQIDNLYENSRRDLNVIALFFENKKPDIQTDEQFQVALKRHLRDAQSVAKFNDNQILDAIPKAKKITEDWTIGTLVKVLTK